MSLMDTTRQSVTLPGPLADFLATEAARLGISVSEMIRHILIEYQKGEKGHV